MEPPLTFDGPEFGVRDRVIVLTHGAGSSSSHPSLAELARLIGEREIAVARFDFPYMRRAEQAGRRAWPPDDEDVLTSTWIGAIRQLLPPKRLVNRRPLAGRAGCFDRGRRRGGLGAGLRELSVSPASPRWAGPHGAPAQHRDPDADRAG